MRQTGRRITKPPDSVRVVTGRFARDDEVEAWQRDGWVLLDGLVDAEAIDTAATGLTDIFPTPAAYHADPDGERRRWLGVPPDDTGWTWPPDGPGFRPEQ